LLAEEKAKFQEQGDAFENEKTELIGHVREYEGKIESLESELAQRNSKISGLNDEISSAKEEVAHKEEELAQLIVSADEKLTAEIEKRQSEIEKLVEENAGLLELKNIAEDAVIKTAAMFESIVNVQSENISSLKSKASSAEQMENKLKQKAENLAHSAGELAGDYENLKEHFREKHKQLLKRIYELRAGLSFADVFCVYDCDSRLKMAKEAGKNIAAMKDRIGTELVGKLKAMLQEIQDGLERSKEQYDTLLEKMYKKQADIKLIAELVKNEHLCRLYGDWIAKLADMAKPAGSDA